MRKLLFIENLVVGVCAIIVCIMGISYFLSGYHLLGIISYILVFLIMCHFKLNEIINLREEIIRGVNKNG